MEHTPRQKTGADYAADIRRHARNEGVTVQSLCTRLGWKNDSRLSGLALARAPTRATIESIEAVLANREVPPKFVDLDLKLHPGTMGLLKAEAKRTGTTVRALACFILSEVAPELPE